MDAGFDAQFEMDRSHDGNAEVDDEVGSKSHSRLLGNEPRIMSIDKWCNFFRRWIISRTWIYTIIYSLDVASYHYRCLGDLTI